MTVLLDEKYEITHDWYTNLTRSYEALQSEPRAQKLNFKPDSKRLILEIGIYEGASTVWWSDNFLEHPESRLITIDPFTGSDEHVASPTQYPTLNRIEQIARTNVARSKQPGKVDIRKGLSWNLFPDLLADIEKGIDILYIDGSHETVAVMRDLTLFYPYVKPGGAVIIDDYAWESVKSGVDACVASFMDVENGFCCFNQLWTIKK